MSIAQAHRVSDRHQFLKFGAVLLAAGLLLLVAARPPDEEPQRAMSVGANLELEVPTRNTASGGCTYDIECDDGMPCTMDSCHRVSGQPLGTGTCEHATAPDGTSGGLGGVQCAAQAGLLCGGCNDGVFCNGVETCQGGACAPGAPPCTGVQVCSESLDECQASACDTQSRCIGGATPGANCSTYTDCASGGRCGFAECEDGLRCNGDETCVGGVCTAAENPCGADVSCYEGKCTGVTCYGMRCNTNFDCSACGGTCTFPGPYCSKGRCCMPGTGGEPVCTSRFKCNEVGGGPCFAPSCDNQGGLFYSGDFGSFPNSDLICPMINDILVRCPKFSSGIAPYGIVTQLVGPVSDSPVVNPLIGVPLTRLGDDYKLSNDPSFLAVNFVRFLGAKIEGIYGVVEFYDESGRFIADSNEAIISDSEFGVQPLSLDSPITIPSQGFVVIRVARPEYSPDVRFAWAATDVVDVGFNDPDVLWVNDGPAANFLTPNPGILAFELEGENVVAPLGACCLFGGGCVDGVLSWVCKAEGNVFLGLGISCPVPACNTGACCDATTGACSVGTDVDCTASDGQFQGFGTDCDPDCCIQHAYTGGNRCEDAIIHNIVVPEPGGPPNVVTITGDNSPAWLEPGEPVCSGSWDRPDLGWYEAFSFSGCAMIRVDYCCSDPVKRITYTFLYDQCPCGPPIPSHDHPYPVHQPGQDGGAPYCDDENYWSIFGPLPGGEYFIPIHTREYGGIGQYQLHVTAEACPLAACCLGDQCVDGVNQLDCDAMGGAFLAPPQEVPLVEACGTATCETGSCCLTPGVCVDIGPPGQFVTRSYCESINGTFSGGLQCHGGTCTSGNPPASCAKNSDCLGTGPCVGTPEQLIQPTPCPLCDLEGPANCQPVDIRSLQFVSSDRHMGTAGILAADDFVPDGDSLTSLCVWGFTLDGDPNSADLDCTPRVAADQFRVRVFANNERTPGGLVGESMASSDRGIVLGSDLKPRMDVYLYAYKLRLVSPIADLTPGETYWLEVSNDPTLFGPQTCSWLWMQQPGTASSYSFGGNDNGYVGGLPVPFDHAFCTNFDLRNGTLGSRNGACCACDGTCSETTLATCVDAERIWDMTEPTCALVQCLNAPPANDNCADGPLLITEGTYTFNNQCATLDGFGPIDSDYGGGQIDPDLWYRFVAPSNCHLTISMCATGTTFDSMLAVYHNPGDPTQCPACPLTQVVSDATLAGEAQDESCVGTAVGGAGLWRDMDQIGRNAIAGECFLIRAGGWQGWPGARGTGILDVSCDPCVPDMSPPCEPPPFSATRFFALGCELFDACYSLSQTDAAIRVHLTSLHHVNPPYSAGASVPFTAFEGQIRWVGPPTRYVESTSNPASFWSANLQCEPYYRVWNGIPILYVTGPEVVPSSTYDYEMLSMTCLGSESTCAAVTPSFRVFTSRWGDVASPFNPPDPSTQPDTADISALVNKFRNAVGAPSKTVALLAGAGGVVDVGTDVGFTHISACVDAFKGQPYPYTMPACP